jgi:hypothetical protein
MPYHTEEQKLFQVGLATDEVAVLRLLRKAYQAQRLQEQTPENKGLEFARWLYLQGRIREDMQQWSRSKGS